MSVIWSLLCRARSSRCGSQSRNTRKAERAVSTRSVRDDLLTDLFCRWVGPHEPFQKVDDDDDHEYDEVPVSSAVRQTKTLAAVAVKQGHFFRFVAFECIENYQVCSVQYCVQQLYTVNCTHIWTDLTVLGIGFCLTGPVSLWLDSLLCMYYFVSDCTLHACVLCSIVTWWGGPGGIEAWCLGLLLPSMLWHCWLGHLTRKTRPRYYL